MSWENEILPAAFRIHTTHVLGMGVLAALGKLGRLASRTFSVTAGMLKLGHYPIDKPLHLPLHCAPSMSNQAARVLHSGHSRSFKCDCGRLHAWQSLELYVRCDDCGVIHERTVGSSEIARTLGISRTQLYRYESGENATPPKMRAVIEKFRRQKEANDKRLGVARSRLNPNRRRASSYKFRSGGDGRKGRTR